MTETIYGPVAGLIIGSLLTRVLLRRLNRGHREPQPGTSPRAAW